MPNDYRPKYMYVYKCLHWFLLTFPSCFRLGDLLSSEIYSLNSILLSHVKSNCLEHNYPIILNHCKNLHDSLC